MTNTAFIPLARLTQKRRLAAETGTLVTASDRLRREYIYAYDHHRMSEGHKAWPEPSISGFETLLRRDHDRARIASPNCPSLLTPVEQHQLFRDCAPDKLVHLTQTFEDAWSMVHAWHIDYDSPEFDATENTRCFVDWAKSVTAALTQLNAITSAQLGDQDYPPSDYRALHLTGFDVLTPQQRRWLDRMEQAGINVFIEEANSTDPRHSTQASQPTLSAQSFRSTPLELTAAICWARARLEASPQDSPPPRIAIVVPDLLAQHATVQRLLRAHLEGTEQRIEALYNIGGGLSLASHPLVESALLLLATIHQPTHYTELQRLLADPSLPAINAHNRLPGDCGEFLTLADLPQDTGSEALRTILRQIVSWHDVASDESATTLVRQTIGEWWNDAASVLRNARWHTARNDSEGYQATNALLELLIAQAPQGSEPVAWFEAYALLESIVAQTLFAPASSPAPIQVLGYLEANELEFDCLWITGMDATAWPTPVTNNPLLPPAELTRVAAPRTTYARELEFAERWIERVTAHPEECRVSFVNDEPDEFDLLAGVSPLVRNIAVDDSQAESAAETFPSADYEPYVFHPLIEYWSHKEIALETKADTNGPSLPGGRLPRATRRLENQAACPMRGWSLHTLDLEEPVTPHSLPNPLERGVLLHNALQRLFEKVTSSAALARLDESAINSLCQEVAEQQTQEELHRFSQTIRALESERLRQSLAVFLRLESNRGEFNVAELEQNITGKIGPWEIHLKVDRVDDSPDGQIVIDYKSTSPSATKLQDQRLTAPQIPLYVLFLLASGKSVKDINVLDPLVKAGAFAELKPEKSRYVGLSSEHAEALQGLKLNSKTPWDEVLRRWCDQLLTLATEIEQGFALANPTKDICSNCHLHSLCRYHLNYD